MTASKTSSVDTAGFQRRRAGLWQAVANDLKRNTSAAALDLGLSEQDMSDVFAGRSAPSAELVDAAVARWPINERDLLPINNDCPDGVLLYRAVDSLASARVFQRGGADYYEYRDTAMSRLSSFRPEWIRMLQVVDDDRVDNPGVQWNQGHLLYQFTYFVGPVNYYYRWDGESHVRRMHTGDSVWGLPFSPHTFTARNDSEPAFILALTYGAELMGDARHELAAMGPQIAAQFAWDWRDPAALRAAILRGHLDCAALSTEEFAARTAIPIDRLRVLLPPDKLPDPDETTAMAVALGVSERDLLPITADHPDGVVVCENKTAPRWGYPNPKRPDYEFTELAHNRLHPHTRGLEIRPRSVDTAAAISTPQHQYLYNIGSTPIVMRWTHGGTMRVATLAPGDSVYVMPFVPCAYHLESDADADTACLLDLRIGGTVTPEARIALGAMHPGGLERLLEEDRPWYRE